MNDFTLPEPKTGLVPFDGHSGPRVYGWRGAGPTDWNAPRYSRQAPTVTVDHVDRLSLTKPRKDQGQEGSCTGFGSNRAIQITTGCGELSEQFTYFGGSMIGGTVGFDMGAIIEDVFTAGQQWGFASEESYPYVAGQFAQRPPYEAYLDAKRNTPKFTALRITTLAQIKHALSLGYGVVIGFSVPQYFESQQVAKDGWIRLPTDNDNMIGGHCVCLDGFDDRPTSSPESMIWAPNSYGMNFGIDGYIRFPQRWFTDPRNLWNGGHAIVKVRP